MNEDISREINSRRRDWMKDFLGAEAAENYQFGESNLSQSHIISCITVAQADIFYDIVQFQICDHPILNLRGSS